MSELVKLGPYALVASTYVFASHMYPSSATKLSDDAIHHQVESKPEWGYDGDIGPEHWAELSTDYALAKKGKSQSPIDIPTNLPVEDLSPINYNYHGSHINLFYDGHTIEEREDQGSSIVLDDIKYELKKFHFHTPSEHTLNGKHYPMELHLVHESHDGQVAVVGVLINEGQQRNPEFATLWDYMPSMSQPHRIDATVFDTEKLLPKDRSAYRYLGSFTTPPCTEGVKWIVLKTPIQVSSKQIAQFRSVVNHNNRPIQPLNGRQVVLSVK